LVKRANQPALVFLDFGRHDKRFVVCGLGESINNSAMLTRVLLLSFVVVVYHIFHRFKRDPALFSPVAGVR